jgi:hypothetical protein
LSIVVVIQLTSYQISSLDNCYNSSAALAQG